MRLQTGAGSAADGARADVGAGGQAAPLQRHDRAAARGQGQCWRAASTYTTSYNATTLVWLVFASELLIWVSSWTFGNYLEAIIEKPQFYHRHYFAVL